MVKIKVLDLILSIKSILTADDRALYTAVWTIEETINKIEEKDGIVLDNSVITDYLKGSNEVEVVFTNKDTKNLLLLMKDKWVDDMKKLENETGSKELFDSYKRLINLMNRLLEPK